VIALIISTPATADDGVVVVVGVLAAPPLGAWSRSWGGAFVGCPLAIPPPLPGPPAVPVAVLVPCGEPRPDATVSIAAASSAAACSATSSRVCC